MQGMRRVTFLSQAALDSYFKTRNLQALIPCPPAKATQLAELSALEPQGMYFELPCNALPGSPVITDHGRAPRTVQSQSFQRHSRWFTAASNSHVYTIHIGLSQQHSMTHQQDAASPHPALHSGQFQSQYQTQPRLQTQHGESLQAGPQQNLSSSLNILKPREVHTSGHEMSNRMEGRADSITGSASRMPTGPAGSSRGADTQLTQQCNTDQDIHSSGMPPRSAPEQQQAASQPPKTWPLPAEGLSSDGLSAPAAGASQAHRLVPAPAAGSAGSIATGVQSAVSDPSMTGAVSGPTRPFKYGAEVDYNPSEAASRAALRVQHSFLVGSEEYLTPSSHTWITIFQKHILSEGLATSLHVLPQLTWFPDPHPNPANTHVDYILHDGAGTVFLCSLLFFSRFHWLSPGTRTRDKVEQLVQDAQHLQAEAAESSSSTRPIGVLRNMRVVPVGMLGALYGITETSYIKGLVSACQEHKVSLFTADPSTLHVAQLSAPTVRAPQPAAGRQAVRAKATLQRSHWRCDRPAAMHSRRIQQHGSNSRIRPCQTNLLATFAFPHRASPRSAF